MATHTLTSIRNALASWGETGPMRTREDLYVRLTEWEADPGCMQDDTTHRMVRDMMDTLRPAHRPRRDPAAARVKVSYRVHPDTLRKIAAEAARTGEGCGVVVDRLAAGL